MNAPPDKYYTAEISWIRDAASDYLYISVPGAVHVVLNRTAETVADCLMTPSAVKAGKSGPSIVVTWSEVPWATDYEVFKSTDMTDWISKGTIGSASFTDRNPAYLNAYRIRAKNATLTSAYSDYDAIIMTGNEQNY